MWRARADDVPVPVVAAPGPLSRSRWITTCLGPAGTRSCSTRSHLDVEENTRQTIEVVAEADAHGAQVEGEIETVLGVEDGVGSDEAATVHPIEVSGRVHRGHRRLRVRPRRSAPRTASTRRSPQLMPSASPRSSQRHPIPMVLHGGTGLTEEQFTDLIARGCAKVNISTALKIAFVDAHREYLGANPGKHDPPSLLGHVREAVKQMAVHHIRMFGSAGKARRCPHRPAEPCRR